MSILDNYNKFISLREKYTTFKYKDYSIEEDKESIILKYSFEIDNLSAFNPCIKITKKNLKLDSDKKYLKNIKVLETVFFIGMIEVISYIKATCSKNIIVECGKLDEYQKEWFIKLYYNGLGEMLYTNGINISKDELFNITINENINVFKEKENNMQFDGMSGNLILVGGGKDSCVTLELLKKEFNDNTALIVGNRKAMQETLNVAGYDENKVIKIERIIDPKLIELNKEGYLNGHTPFSALLAFLSYLVGILSKKKYIVLSNESSANESNIPGTKINHQYSKSYEFETDFTKYINKYLNLPIKYYSILRPLTELQIAYVFSQLKKYHSVFKSCNVGLKENVWCCNCAKCLFVYIILSPFLSEQELTNIFGENLFNRKDLLTLFVDLIGQGKMKPFECVGTFDEINLSIYKTIKDFKYKKDKENVKYNKTELPYLLQHYYDNYYIRINEKYKNINFDSILKEYNNNNNVEKKYKEKIEKYLKR